MEPQEDEIRWAKRAAGKREVVPSMGAEEGLARSSRLGVSLHITIEVGHKHYWTQLEWISVIYNQSVML